MFTAIKGTYENGHLILEEPAPTKEKVPVLVTFLEKVNLSAVTPKFGSAKGKIKIAADFDEPLDDFKEYM